MFVVLVQSCDECNQVLVLGPFATEDEARTVAGDHEQTDLSGLACTTAAVVPIGQVFDLP